MPPIHRTRLNDDPRDGDARGSRIPGKQQLLRRDAGLRQYRRLIAPNHLHAGYDASNPRGFLLPGAQATATSPMGGRIRLSFLLDRDGRGTSRRALTALGAFLFRNLGSGPPRFGMPDRNRLLATRHFLAGGTAAQRTALRSSITFFTLACARLP
jgi:hypothetical protein